MKVQVYGSGCEKCKKLAANVETAAKELGVEIELEKITDINAITDAGVMMTPALAVNDQMVGSGKVLSVQEIGKILQNSGGTQEDRQLSEKSCCCCDSAPTKVESSCCGEGTGTASCCGGKNKGKTVLTVFLLILVVFSIIAMVVREIKSPAIPADNMDTAIQTVVPTAADALVVYYFHGTQRCMTCNRIEELTRQAIQSNFAGQLADGKIVFRSVNVDEPENEHFIKDFQLVTRSVVMRKGDKFEKFDQVWNLVREPDKFSQYIRNGVETMSK